MFSFLVLFFSVLLTACNTLLVADNRELSSTDHAETENLATLTPISEDSAEEANIDQMESSLPSAESKTADADIEPQAENSAQLDEDLLYYLLAAEFAGNAGDVKTSLDFYRQASESIEDSRIAARTAYIAMFGGDYDATLKALGRWQQLEPDSIEMIRMYAITYLKLEQPEKAVHYIEKILSSSHESTVDEAMAVKQLLAKEASTKTAYGVLQELNKNEDKNTHLLILQSRYAAELKQYDEALDLLDQVLLVDPSLTEVLIIKARILVAQGKSKEASQQIKLLLDEHPDNDALRLQYARMLIEQQDLPGATEHYEILYTNLPEQEDIALSLGLIYIETKKLDKAVDVLEHLIEIDKKTDVANYYLGRIAQNQGQDRPAINYYLQVTGGEYAFDAQLRVGVLLAILGKPDEGLAKLALLSESQVDWSLRVKAYLAQGEILRGEQRYKEGVEMYSRALEQKHEDTDLLYARGLMAEKVDRLDLAESDLLLVISKEPKNANALNALGYTLADRTARYEEALAYIKRAVELVPDDPAILDSLGWVSYRLGNYDDAIKWLSQAFEKLEDAEIAAHYGEVLWKTNQQEKARKVWQKGKMLNAKNPVLVETMDRLLSSQ